MILRIVALKVHASRLLDVTFNNGVRKRVDISPLLEGPIFAPLRSNKYFVKVKLDPECGTVVWPNGADLAPETLLALADESKMRRRAKSPRRKEAARSR